MKLRRCRIEGDGDKADVAVEGGDAGVTSVGNGLDAGDDAAGEMTEGEIPVEGRKEGKVYRHAQVRRRLFDLGRRPAAATFHKTPMRTMTTDPKLQS